MLVPADLLRPALSQLTVADVFENLALQSCLPKDFVLLVAKLLQLRQSLFQILSVAGESAVAQQIELLLRASEPHVQAMPLMFVAKIPRLLEALYFAAHVGDLQVGNLKLSLLVAIDALAETGLDGRRQERFNRTCKGYGFLRTLPPRGG